MFGIIFNKRAIQSLYLAAIISLVALLIGYFALHYNLRENETAFVEKTISSKVALIDGQLKSLLQLDPDSLYTAVLIPALCEKGISLFVFQNNRLAYWSSNTTPVGYFYDSVFEQNQVIRLENGYYLPRAIRSNEQIFVGLLLIKNSYGYENEYITNDFNTHFSLPDQTEISLTPSVYNVNDKQGEFLFSLQFSETTVQKQSLTLLLFTLYLTAFMLIINALYHIYRGLNVIYSRKKWIFAFLVADVILLRAVLFYFNVPGILYETRLFAPSYLAISGLIPSLGDLVINAVILLMLSWYFFKSFRFDFKPGKSGMWKSFTGFSLIFHIFIFFYVFKIIFSHIVFDSVISFNLGNIFGLTVQSFLGFVAIAAMLLAFFLISTRLYMAARELFPERGKFFLLLLGTTTIAGLVSVVRGHFEPLMIFFVFFFVLGFMFQPGKKTNTFSFANAIIFIVGFSLITSFYLQTLNTEKENHVRKLLAIHLASERDKIAEYRFKNIENKIYQDDYLLSILAESYWNEELEREFEQYLIENFFDRYWSRFNLQVTICYPGKELHIRPGDYIVGCESYFERYINTLGEETDCENLFYIFPGINYLARFDFSGKLPGFEESIKVYIEINSRAVAKGLGYPELLIDETTGNIRDIYHYSYATFVKGELVRSVGKYPYTIKDIDLPAGPELFLYFYRNHYHHLLYNASPSTRLVVSLPKPVFTDLLAPFSYLFIFFGLFVFLFSLIVSFPFRKPVSEVSFRNRVQYSMFGIVLVSFLVIGISSLFYINRLNHNKNLNILSEKNHSVLIELEHKLAGSDALSPEMSDYLDELLTKFSLVFFSDINLYDPNGWLLASSRPQIFEEGLISVRMHPEAYRQLSHNLKSSFIHQEAIGNYRYLSAYLPFRNDRNELIGYVNLPYFARQSELRQEVSNFLVAFTNIYVVLMAIALFLALLLSDYLIRPLMLLKSSLRKVKLSESTHKIQWKGNDEISELINEYNRMTDELVKSAEMLARSERESAWREMAKQVAHEIKNPLTPMKLSVQYLQKAWNDQAPDWDERLKRFTETLTHQIDTLSEIASAFSDFATMPAATHEKVNLAEIVHSAAALHGNLENISINLNVPNDEIHCNVLADKRQMLRVFNNLIKNSVQAIEDAPDGRIDIEISRAGDHWQVQVYDNGAGISSEQQEKIFSPYFTTKSSGMGLGLAIVKNIISGIGGTISFQSEEKSGTTFRIMLPVYEDNSD